MTDAEKIAELRADKDRIMALLRYCCMNMDAARCRNTIAEAVRQYDAAKLQQAKDALA